MESESNTIVQTHILHLTDIIDMINRGEIRVPNFQRPFTWRPENMISLFESIQKGYPIGSLLFWETSNEFESLMKIGPFEMLASEKKEIKYILDGHQRISTVFGILKPLNEVDQIEKDPWWNLYFDLEKEEFMHHPSKLKINTPNIQMHKIIRTLDFLKECKRIQNEYPENVEKYIDRAEKLAQSIRGYRIPVTQIMGGSLDNAVEIFSRLNTSGVRMTTDQMLSALTYREGENKFNLASRIDDILLKLAKYGFESIDRIFIFRSIVASLEKDIYKIKYNTIRHYNTNMEQTLVAAEKSMLEGANFLSVFLNIPGNRLLPYSLQFVFMSEFFRNCPSPNPFQFEMLKKWFWVTSYTGWFASANSTKIGAALDDMRCFARGESILFSSIDFNEKASILPDKMDFRFARVKCFVLFLNSLNPILIGDNESIDSKKALMVFGSKALSSAVPNNNSVSNKILSGPLNYTSVKKTLEESDNISNEFLSSHGLDRQMLQFLFSDETKFLIYRKRKLMQLESEFMTKIGVTPNDSNDFSLDIATLFDSTE